MSNTRKRSAGSERLVVPVPVAGKLTGDLSRGASYKAARNGDLPTIEIGGRKSVPVSWLAERLGVERSDVVEAASAIEAATK